MTICLKHKWSFVKNMKFTKAIYRQSGPSTITVSIRGVYKCDICGKTSKRTANPNAEMPVI